MSDLPGLEKEDRDHKHEEEERHQDRHRRELDPLEVGGTQKSIFV